MKDDQFIVSFEQIPAFARAMKFSAPKIMLREAGRAFFKIGKSDIDKLKTEQLQGAKLNVRSKGFLNAFKFRASDSRSIDSIDQLQLSEYTGAKPFAIFNTGGDISPERSRTLTVLAPGGRDAAGKRKYSRQQIRAMLNSGEAQIIKTRSGPAVVLSRVGTTKSGALRRGSKMIVIAWLRPRVHEQKRIDFEGNFASNESEHNRILEEASDRAIEKTERMEDEE